MVQGWLAWKRVARDVAEGTLGSDFDRTDRAEIEGRVREAEEAAKDEVWAGYRFVVLADHEQRDGLKVIDLGAGHASGAESLCGRVLTALKSQALLNESVGAGYLDRNWPPALRESGAWPLSSLRQSFLNGALTRLLDPDGVLRARIAEFVGRGDFGLASGPGPDGAYHRVWHAEMVAPDEVSFETGVVLLTKDRARALKAPPVVQPPPVSTDIPVHPSEAESGSGPLVASGPSASTATAAAPGTIALRLVGSIPPESWNRVGTRLLPKLRAGQTLQAEVNPSVVVDARVAGSLEADLRRTLEDLGLSTRIRIERTRRGHWRATPSS